MSHIAELGELLAEQDHRSYEAPAAAGREDCLRTGGRWVRS
jgi:hypothetical protein